MTSTYAGQQAMDDIEALLALVHRAGEWDDSHDEILSRWRASRGEEGMSKWVWWAGEVGADLYGNELPTRQEAIEWARAEYGADAAIEVIEARCWDDEIEGEDNFYFAATRNHEVISPDGRGFEQ